VKIQNSVALVTGANRGLGLAFTQALLAGGAGKVYAAARDAASVKQADVVPVRLDVTDPEQVAAVAAGLGDVNLLINNAGIIRGSGFLGEQGVEAVRAEFETNFFGPLQVSRAFAPILARNGGGAIVNVLSALSWVAFPSSSTYSASKAAAWAFSNGLRNELRGQGTQVLSLHVGYIGYRHGASRRGTQVEARGRREGGSGGARGRQIRGAGRRGQPADQAEPVG